MLELIGFAVLTGLAGASAKQIANSVKPAKKNRKGKAKPVSDFQRRKAAARKKSRK